FFASLGLPGLAGFVSEFMVFNGSFATLPWHTALAATSVIITAAYYLWTIQRMFLGSLNTKYAHLPDLNWRERFTLYPLAVLCLVFGFYPNIMLKLINTDLFALLRAVKGA
ncbi:MAG: NADH-quinone oxidoreductase subunit M, partial [Myxococcaceae bacterium]